SAPLLVGGGVLGGLGRRGLRSRGGLGAGDLGDGRLGSDLAGRDGDDTLRRGALGGVGDRAGRGLDRRAAGLGTTGGGAGGPGTTLRALGALATLLPLGEGLEGRTLGAGAA